MISLIEPSFFSKFSEISKEIIKNISDWVWETDEWGNFTYYSKQSDIFHKFTFEQFLDKNLFEIIPQKYLEKKKAIFDFRAKFIDIKGITLYYSINAFHFHDDKNHFKGYRGTIKLLNQVKEKINKVIKLSEIFPLIHEYLNDLIIILDNKFRIVYFNQENFIKTLGYREDEITKKIVLNSIHPDEKKKFYYFLRDLREKQNDTIELRFRDYTDKWMFFEVSGKILDFKSSKIMYLLNLHDITKYKLSEEELIKSEKRFRNIYESSPNAILIIDDNGVIIDCNPTSEILSGFLKSELIGKKFNEVHSIPNQYFSKVRKDFLSLFKGKIPKREIQLYNKNKDIIWVQYSASLISLGSKNYIEVIIQDIQQRKEADMQLKESEEKFRSIAENLWVGICIFQNYEVKYINHRAAELSGYPLNEIKNWKVSNFLEIIHPDDVTQFKIAIQQMRKEENFHLNFQYRVISKDGEIRWLKSSSKPIQYMGKSGEYFMSLDITDIKNTEEKLKLFNRKLEEQIELRTIELIRSKQQLQRKSEEQALLLNNIDIQIWNLKSENTYSAINKAHSEFFGVDQIDVENKKIIDYRLPDEYKKCIDGNREVFTKKKQIKTEEWLTSKTGNRRCFSIIKTPKLDVNGNVEYVICTSQDITDPNLIQMQLAESEKRFRTIAEQALMGIVIIQNGVIKYGNQAFSSLIRYSLEEIMNWRRFEIKKIIHPDDFIFIMNNLTEITRSQETGINEKSISAQIAFKIITKFNKIKWVDAYFKDIPFQEHSALLAMIVDITEKKRYEENLISSERKLREQNIELKNLDKLKSDFITIAAHELKTPLISIIGYLDLILSRDNDLKVETLEDLSRSLKNASRLEYYIDQLMDVMKIDAKKIELILKEENIVKIINKCLAYLNFQIIEKEVNIEVLIEKNLSLNIDPTRIMQVFTNLLSNAVKFSERGGQVLVSSEKKQNFQLFKIKDFGIGLSEREIKQLFGKFAMIDQKPENYSKFNKGSGLGLYITKGIIEAHGGKIWVESLGKKYGAEFYFTLPRE